MLPVSILVQQLNRFCWQKAAGGLSLPKLDSRYCLLCNRGCICIGSSCKGRKLSCYKKPDFKLKDQAATVIPGLSKHRKIATGTTKKKAIVSISALSTKDPIFSPKPNSTARNRKDQKTGREKKVREEEVEKDKTEDRKLSKFKLSNLKKLNLSSKSYDPIKLRSILLRSSLGRNKQKGEAKDEKIHNQVVGSCTSLYRKLNVSELSCVRNRCPLKSIYTAQQYDNNNLQKAKTGSTTLLGILEKTPMPYMWYNRRMWDKVNCI